MSALTKLKAATSRADVASLLGYRAASLSYILYRLPSQAKYTTFQIEKASGGVRTIMAPVPELKLLQSRLADVLYDCIEEMRSRARMSPLAHGFARGGSILTNATQHQRRRYVLNLDLADFFPSFNFGRVRGFFIKDKNFALSEPVATVLAQIACHNNELPQGSPCSPVISNLITHLLDVRLAQLAKQHRCTYSRYADDLTFSTNKRDFPPELAIPNAAQEPEWTLGAELVKAIKRAGFDINHTKTRMQIKNSRQTVTGLIVNSKVNIRQEYYRTARSMCNSLFGSGQYFRKPINPPPGFKPSPTSNLNEIEGILSHIFMVKDAADSRSALDKKREQIAARRLYKDFLYYKYFQANTAPLIITEGKTDASYLRSAIKMSPAFHPSLGEYDGSAFRMKLRFLKFSKRTHDILQLGGGTGDIKHFLLQYRANLSKFRSGRPFNPVIVLIDNDDGAKEIFSVVKSMVPKGTTVSLLSTDPFYKIFSNLYLIKTPEIGDDGKSCIEEFFPSQLLETEVNGKKFDPAKAHDEAGKYGKQTFAERVVRPNEKTIDFSRFHALLSRIEAAIADY